MATASTVQVFIITLSNNPGTGCEQGLNEREKFVTNVSNAEVIPVSPGFLPKLLLPWNRLDQAEERCFLGFVHTMKKKIL